MKNSKQRDLILRIVNESSNHPTAYDIYTLARSEIDNISLGTVYRNLNLLVNTGLIKRISMSNGIDRFDKSCCTHAHFMCDRCNYIYDLEDVILPEQSIDGNKILNYDVKYTGICHKCLKEEEI